MFRLRWKSLARSLVRWRAIANSVFALCYFYAVIFTWYSGKSGCIINELLTLKIFFNLKLLRNSVRLAMISGRRLGGAIWTMWHSDMLIMKCQMSPYIVNFLIPFFK